MRLRILFVKKKYIYFFIFFILLFIVSFIFFQKTKSVTTLNFIKESKLIKKDFTGDGKEDMLYIKTEGKKYYLQINTNKDSYYLEPNNKLNTLGEFYPYWPMKLNFIDISRDKTPEIFVQSSQNNIPLQHIFKWNNSKFEDIYCSNNNIIGFLDYNNNKTTKFISGIYKNQQLDLNYFILLSNKLKNFSYENYALPGKDQVLKFIRFIESLPEGEIDQPDIFYDGLTGKDISLIGKLAGENNNYSFEDGIFMDTKCDKNGDPIEFKWTLNFKALPKTPNLDLGFYSITIYLKPCASYNNEFRIFSMNLNKNDVYSK